MRKTKILVIAAFALLFFADQFISETAKASDEKQLTKAREIADGLMKGIRGVLMEQLKDGNFAAASEVCAGSAQTITENYSDEIKAKVYRVSLKARNPSNQPDKQETKALKHFEKRASKGESLGEYSKVVKRDGKKEFLYMKPVVIQDVCLKCHGSESDIPKDVADVIKRTFPKDKAIGYKNGEVRGAVVVRLPIE